MVNHRTDELTEEHPAEELREDSSFVSRLLRPFRALRILHLSSRGIAPLNPGLISGTPLACLYLLALLAGSADGFASDSRPFATVQPLAPSEARWTAGFWAERFELCRTQAIPAMERLMMGTNYTQFFRNFEIAAGLADGRSRGAPFNDGDFYKWMEAACALLARTNDAGLEKQLDDIIAVIAQAQRADGYLHTPALIRARNGDTNAVPFQDRNNFEMYNLGHLMTTACLHHRVTNKTNLLAVARKAADFLDRTFSGTAPEVARSSVCPSHYMGIVEFNRETRDPRYLELAKRFFALRGQIADGSDDNQDRIPFEQQTNAVGHAVRANYLYAGAADLFMETGDKTFWQPLEPIWQNVTRRKMYITGGCGALYDGASPDGAKEQKSITRVHQAYGRNYQLPNTTAHSETCANIGNVLWNWRMFLATGEAKFMDVLELALYNSVLSGMSLDGTNFFYTNPLRVTEPLPTELRWSRTRVPFVSSFCCPPNVLRTIAESAQYAFATCGDAIWVNLYGGSALSTTLGGQPVKLSVETEYPWSGRIRIRIVEGAAKEFALKLRIPGWVTQASLRLNQGPSELSPKPGSYSEIRRVWTVGDIVELDMPMPVEPIEANPLVEETLGQVAVKRGPIVYCLESADLPADAKLLDVFLDPAAELRARYDQRLLGGVVVLEGTAQARKSAAWGSETYRELTPTRLTPIRLKLIPYFAWANRGAGEMTVWMQHLVAQY